jgi:large subunit ribosomal protein L23
MSPTKAKAATSKSAKASAKTAEKKAAKAAAKTAAKTADKTVAKTADKTAAKAPDKTAAKTSARSPARAAGSKYKPERLLTLLLAPTVSEKATQIADQHSQVVFRVMQDATKPEVKAAVELLFKVDVEAVRIANVKGKAKRFGAYSGRRRHWKKAYVSLKPGQEINFAQEG